MENAHFHVRFSTSRWPSFSHSVSSHLSSAIPLHMFQLVEKPPVTSSPVYFWIGRPDMTQSMPVRGGWEGFYECRKARFGALLTKQSLLPLLVLSNPWFGCWTAAVQGVLQVPPDNTLTPLVKPILLDEKRFLSYLCSEVNYFVSKSYLCYL